ncbi:MAG: hypothetical protein K2X77_03585 [Candidatus Obscuribacterales bacterium]|jgi:hypothetical protein|nr:hypothetical protein [Candidatus Obscuribacterales bacterium]
MPSIEELKSNITSLLKESLSEFKPNWGKLIGAGLLMFAAALPVIGVELGLMSVTGIFSQNTHELSWIFYLVMPIVMLLHVGLIVGMMAMQVGFASLCLKMVRKENFTIISELKSGLPKLLPMFLASLVMAPAIFLGLLCFVVPGIYLAMRFAFFSVAIADGHGPIEALKKSFRITRGHLIEMIALFALYQVSSFVLAFIPIVNLFILLFFVLPFMNFFWAKYYVSLESNELEQGSFEYNTVPARA